MPRRSRPFIRDEAERDARLIVIATEDTKAAQDYFEALKMTYQSPRVHVELLKRDTTASSPQHVLAQLDAWKSNYQVNEDDELWLVIDKDHWTSKQLREVAQRCSQRPFFLAISNPCIELWFLLHWTDLQPYNAPQQAELLANKKINKNRTRLEQEIITVAGQFNKSNLNTADYMPHVTAAISRAQALDKSPTDRWPQKLGTHVYRVAQSIIQDRAPQ